MNSINSVLYGYSLFGSTPGNMNYDQQLAAVQNSGFTTIILWTLHVHANGDLYYNDTLIVSNGVYSNPKNPSFSKYVASLKSNSKVTKVLFGLGSGGATDFAAIKSLMATQPGTQTLIKNFLALQQNVPVDGFDFDLEEFPLEDYSKTVTGLSLVLNKQLKVFITFCPYCDSSFWVNCLTAIYSQNNSKQIVAWMNLQCYDGGSGNDPASWAQDIQNAGSPTGINNPAAFVIPGYWCYNTTQKSYMGQCPEQIQKTFEGLTTDDPGIAGGFIWNSSDIFTNQNSKGCSGSMDCKAYATAIQNGLTNSLKATIPKMENLN